MKFIKIIRNTSLQFELDDKNEDNITAKVTIPPYGQWKRGEQYFIEELNQIVLQEVGKNLTPTRNEGRFKALKEKTKFVHLEFKNTASNKKVEKTVTIPAETVEQNATGNTSKKSTRTKNTRTKKR